MAISKMVKQRLDNARELTNAIENLKAQLAKAVVELLTPHLENNETLDKSQVELFMTLLVRGMVDRATRLQTSDEDHSREQGEDVEARKALYNVLDDAYTKLLDFKDAVRKDYGEEGLQRIQVHGATPRDPSSVAQQLSLVVSWLDNPTTSFPNLFSSFSTGIDKQTASKVLAPHQQSMQGSLDTYTREQKESGSALVKKNERLDDYDSYQSPFHKIFAGLLEIVQMNEEASRFNVKRRRKSNSEDAETSTTGNGTSTEAFTPATTTEASSS